jgi:uncharacterized protein YdcH (DUF465 family)
MEATVDLEAKHQEIHAVVDHLESQRYLTSEEETRLKALKKQRLWIKDRILVLGRS